MTTLDEEDIGTLPARICGPRRHDQPPRAGRRAREDPRVDIQDRQGAQIQQADSSKPGSERWLSSDTAKFIKFLKLAVGRKELEP